MDVELTVPTQTSSHAPRVRRAPFPLPEKSTRAPQEASAATVAVERSVPPIRLLFLAVAFASLFWVNLDRLWQWTNPASGDPNWGHALFIPLISLAYLLDRRDRLRQAQARACLAGLPLIALGISLFCGGITLGVEFARFGPYIQDLGMLTTLFGTVLSVFGPAVVRVSLFPIAYLLCALPWPSAVHDALTHPMQDVAATASVHILQWTGLNVEQVGNTLHILTGEDHGVPDRALNVAEACSGMRSLITFIAIGLAVAFLSARPLWQKLVISVAAVPIAIACNVFRIVGEAMLDQWVGRSLTEGFAHSAVGLVLLVPGFGLFLLVGVMLDRLVVRPRGMSRGGAARLGRAHDAATTTALPRRRDLVPRGRITPRAMCVVVASALFAAAVALGATSQALHLHFRKVPVPLSRPLTELPADLGPWQLCGGDHAIPDEVRRTLGTEDYIFRDYVDTRAVGGQTVAALKAADPAAAAALLRTVAAARPDAIVRVAVTYYTGRVDAVIHQSERCNLAAGIATAVESEPATWDLGGRPLAVRVVRLINDAAVPAGEGERSRYVAYCYRVNGREETEAWRVRGLLMNVFERSAWYAKIEVTTNMADRGECQRVLSDFLKAALPEIERCLPPSADRRPVVATEPPAGPNGPAGGK